MPALPPALDTPATPRTPLAAPPRPTRSRPRPVLPPLGRLPRHKGGAVVAIARAVRQRRGLRPLGRFGGGRVAGAGAVRRRGGWQDLLTMHDSRDPCSEKGPFLAGSSRGVSSDGGLRGFSDAWRAHPAKASPFSDAWRANLATNWRFSRPRPLSGCMERKTCRGLPPGNAPRRNLATARPPGTHRARTLPPSNAGGTHFAGILPSASVRERIRAQSCHRQAPHQHVNEELA